MMNPDGSFLGNTRGNLLGQDLNRHWHEPCPNAHPTVHAVRGLVERIDSGEEGREMDLDLELVSENNRLYFFSKKPNKDYPNLIS